MKRGKRAEKKLPRDSTLEKIKKEEEKTRDEISEIVYLGNLLV